jgi:hypothetical protein
VISRISTGRDLAAPALGDLVELDAQDLVDLVALGQHIVEEDVAHHGTEGGRGDVLEGTLEVLDLDDAPIGVDDAPVDQEVDADRRVVLRDAGLAGNLDEPLAQVDLHRALGDRHDEDPARALDLGRAGATQGEDQHALVLIDDLDRRDRDDRDDQDDERRPPGWWRAPRFPPTHLPATARAPDRLPR